MQKLRLAYFGTPDFSASFLEKLLTDKDIPVEVSLVVTQPDRPAGRKQAMTATPVKKIAEQYSVSCVEYSGQKPQNTEDTILKTPLKDVDLALVYAFGEIIPKELLGIPKYGFWNVHPSFLPKYRGAAPMATPLMIGDQETGVTLIKMDEEVDHGPIIAQEKASIDPKDKRPDLERKLTDLGYELFKKNVFQIDELKTKEQDHEKATFTQRLTKEDGFIKSTQFTTQDPHTAAEIFNIFRGLYPWPGLWTLLHLPASAGQARKGTIIEKRLKITDMDLVDGKLVIKKVQLEGKNEVDFDTFNRAYKLF